MDLGDGGLSPQRKRIFPRCNAYGLGYLMSFAIAVSSCGPDSPFGPVPVGFGEERVFSTHREIDVGFASDDGTVLAGTLNLPLGSGPHPAILFHFGFGEWTRARFESSAIREWPGRTFASPTSLACGLCVWKPPTEAKIHT